jgi:hypothetical protein
MYIALRQGNQGYSFLDAKYKIIWSYNATDRFFYTEKPVIWARNKMLGIASNDRQEILYIFAILNSKITKFILSTFVKIAREETRTILVSLQIVKKQLRIPRITTETQPIKEAVIQYVNDLLQSEHTCLADFVDFSDTLLQRFDGVYVENNMLVLSYDNREVKLRIKRNAGLVADTISGWLRSKGKTLAKGDISLHELSELTVIDFQKQAELKEQIDDLVYALYFNIPLDKGRLEDTTCCRLL